MSPSSLRIAVLDDEPGFRLALSRLLRSWGHQVEPFATGAVFLAAVGASSFDCLLLDLHMPEVTGFDVLQDLKTREIHLPVIVITGHDQAGSAQTTHDLGAVQYLLKPIDETILLAAIGTATAPAR